MVDRMVGLAKITRKMIKLCLKRRQLRKKILRLDKIISDLFLLRASDVEIEVIDWLLDYRTMLKEELATKYSLRDFFRLWFFC